MGDVERTKAEVARQHGLRGGRPRKDGLVPGSPEALAKDNAAAAARMQRLREFRAGQKLAPLPPMATPEPGTAAGATNPDQTIPVDFAGGMVAQPVGWTPADLQPVVENAIAVGEEWDFLDNRKIIAPLELDAPAQMRILQPTRWPQSAKVGLQRGGAESLAELFNAAGVPVAVKKHLLSFPAAMYLFQHISANKAELRKLVEQEVAKKKGEVKAEPEGEKKP